MHSRVRKVTKESAVAPLVSSRPFSQGSQADGHLPFKNSPVVIIQFEGVLLGREALLKGTCELLSKARIVLSS